MKIHELKPGDLILPKNRENTGPGFWCSEKEFLASCALGLYLRDPKNNQSLVKLYPFHEYWFYRIDRVEKDYG